MDYPASGYGPVKNNWFFKLYKITFDNGVSMDVAAESTKDANYWGLKQKIGGIVDIEVVK